MLHCTPILRRSNPTLAWGFTFGSLVLFDSLLRLLSFRPKSVQDGSSMAHLKMAQDGPKMAPRWPSCCPRWPQDGPCELATFDVKDSYFFTPIFSAKTSTALKPCPLGRRCQIRRITCRGHRAEVCCELSAATPGAYSWQALT